MPRCCVTHQAQFFLINNSVFFTGRYLNTKTSGISSTGISGVLSIAGYQDTLSYQTLNKVVLIDTTNNTVNTLPLESSRCGVLAVLGEGLVILSNKTGDRHLVVCTLDHTIREVIEGMCIAGSSDGNVVLHGSDHVSIYNTKTREMCRLDTFTHHIARVCVSSSHVTVVNTKGHVAVYSLNSCVRTERVSDTTDCSDIITNTRLTQLVVFERGYVAKIGTMWVVEVDGVKREFSLPDSTEVFVHELPVFVLSGNLMKMCVRSDYTYIKLIDISIARC